MPPAGSVLGFLKSNSYEYAELMPISEGKRANSFKTPSGISERTLRESEKNPGLEYVTDLTNNIFKAKKVVSLKKQVTLKSKESSTHNAYATNPVTSRHSNPRSTAKPSKKKL